MATANIQEQETTTAAVQSEEGTATTTETHAEGGLSGVVGTFGLRPDIFLAQLVNFVLVLLVLWKFAYKPILKMLDERQQKIAESVKHAAEIEERLKETDAAKAELLEQARKEAQEMLTKAAADSELRKGEMIAAAKKEVERVIENGKAQLQAEQSHMLIEARKEMVEIAVKAAAKIIAEKLDEKKSKSLAEEVVRKLT